MFINQLIALPALLISSIFLYKEKKNYFITFIPMLFYVFILSTFILNAKIGFNINLIIAQSVGTILAVLSAVLFIYKMKKEN